MADNGRKQFLARAAFSIKEDFFLKGDRSGEDAEDYFEILDELEKIGDLKINIRAGAQEIFTELASSGLLTPEQRERAEKYARNLDEFRRLRQYHSQSLGKTYREIAEISEHRLLTKGFDSEEFREAFGRLRNLHRAIKKSRMGRGRVARAMWEHRYNMENAVRKWLRKHRP